MLSSRSILFAILLGAGLGASAQATSAQPPKPGRPVPASLRVYTSCKLPGGPDLLQTASLPQAPMTRTAQTLTGPKPIRLVDGTMSAFGYGNGAPFANVKVEQLPVPTYAREKADLVSEFDAINAKGEDTQRNYALKPTLNGFEIYGFDRTALDGNVLGIYLFFDNAHHVATTAYFLNAPRARRNFTNVGEYAMLREGFLNAYTGCVHKAISGGAPTPAKKAPAKAVRRR